MVNWGGEKERERRYVHAPFGRDRAGRGRGFEAPASVAAAVVGAAAGGGTPSPCLSDDGQFWRAVCVGEGETSKTTLGRDGPR